MEPIVIGVTHVDRPVDTDDPAAAEPPGRVENRARYANVLEEREPLVAVYAHVERPIRKLDKGR